MITTRKDRVLQMRCEQPVYKNSRWRQFSFPDGMVLGHTVQLRLKNRLMHISAVQTAEVYDEYVLVCARRAASWEINSLLIERIREEIAKDA